MLGLPAMDRTLVLGTTTLLRAMIIGQCGDRLTPLAVALRKIDL